MTSLCQLFVYFELDKNYLESISFAMLWKKTAGAQWIIIKHFYNACKNGFFVVIRVALDPSFE